jgi:Flp pilus assembly pilin Flp
MRFAQLIAQLHREESGQDMLEYALVLLAVLLAVVAGTGTLATDIKANLDAIQVKIAAAIA